MKVGLITHHWVPNFGANLQALATKLLLENMGHQVLVINYRPLELIKLYNKTVPEVQHSAHANFTATYLKESALYTDRQSMIDSGVLDTLDVVISGSDAVFRLNPDLPNREDLSFPNPFWVDSCSEKAIFWAASSMGTHFKTLSKEVSEGINQTLSKARLISVRDRWTSEHLENLLGKPVSKVIDPLFFLTDFLDIEGIELSCHIQERYILINLYKGMVTHDWLERLDALARDAGLEIVALPNPENNSVSLNRWNKVELPLSPIEWLKLIRNSSGYIGVRFHPVVACMTANIPFVSFDTYQTKLLNRYSSKTYDICKHMGLENYCLSRIEKILLSPRRVLNLLLKNIFNVNDKVYSEKQEMKRLLSNALYSS